MGITQIVINHTPHRCFSGTGCKSYNFDSMLTVENIVDSIPAADFHRIDLEDVKILRCFLNVCLGKITLVILIGNQILYEDLLKMHIGDKTI